MRGVRTEEGVAPQRAATSIKPELSDEPTMGKGVEIPADAQLAQMLQEQEFQEAATEAPTTGGASSSSMAPPASSGASTSAATISSTGPAAGSTGSAAAQLSVEGVAPQRAATSTESAPAASSPTKRLHPFHVEVGDVQPPLKVRFLEPEIIDIPAKEPMQKVPRFSKGDVRQVMATLNLIKGERNRRMAIREAIAAVAIEMAKERCDYGALVGEPGVAPQRAATGLPEFTPPYVSEG